MSTPPVCVFRTDDPAVLAGLAEAKKKIDEWHETVSTFAESVTGDSSIYVNTFLDHTWVSGLVLAEDADVPAGWRRSPRQKDRIIPDRRTKAGKEVAAALSKLGSEPPLRGALPGMPVEVRGPGDEREGTTRVYTFGLDDKSSNDSLTVTWGVAVDDELVNLDVWTRIPLSQYHLELEAKAESNG